MTGVYEVFLALAEKLNGTTINGQFAKDVIWLISFLFGFWLLVLIALTPYYLIKWIFNRK